MKRKDSRATAVLRVSSVMILLLGAAFAAQAADGKKPNILILWGDDVGYWNVSAYNQGMMGYRTPNIDRIARDGALFTDWYGQQSCTAGRAAFITGQVGFRTGMLKVGLPGAKEGLAARDVTIAELLKAHLFVLVPAQEYVGKFLQTFKEFPPSQKPGSFGIDDALESLQTAPNVN